MLLVTSKIYLCTKKPRFYTLHTIFTLEWPISIYSVKIFWEVTGNISVDNSLF